MADWNKIKKEYIAGNVTYMELSEKHRVSFSTLTKVARREKWRELKQKASEKTDNDVVKSVGARNAKLNNATDLAIDALCDILQRGKDGMRASEVRDCVAALKVLYEMKGIKNEADAEEQRARIAALRARAAASKLEQGDEEDEGGVILLPAVDKPEGGTDGG